MEFLVFQKEQKERKGKPLLFTCFVVPPALPFYVPVVFLSRNDWVITYVRK